MSKLTALIKLREAIDRQRELAKAGDSMAREYVRFLLERRNQLQRLHGKEARDFIEACISCHD